MQFKGLFANPWGSNLQETAIIGTTICPAYDQVTSATGAAPAPVDRTPKRSYDDIHNEHNFIASTSKRVKVESGSPAPPPTRNVSPDSSGAIVCEQLGLEVLLKHQELRLIDQELAKCQIALEQLRRCHLIPYPTSCPTPEQMLQISSGEGAVLKPLNGVVPTHAPPFGVVDGPYVRHYAKWLIPDPSFDGEEFGLRSATEAPRARLGAKNGIVEGVRGRTIRGAPATRLEAIPNSYAPRPRDKSNIGPCIIARADGIMVKLVCTGCSPSRDNFSNTQGFINHCRISHGHHLKSHEEAAAQCGQPIAGDETTPMVVPREKLSAPPPPLPQPSAAAFSAHPLTRSDLTHAEACASLKARIDAYFAAEKAPDVMATKPFTKVVSVRTELLKKPLGPQASTTPYLARILHAKGFQGDIEDLVVDARTKEWDDSGSDDETSDEAVSSVLQQTAARKPATRTPARTTVAPIVSDIISTGEVTPTSFKARSANADISSVHEDDIEAPSLSPNAMTANNAPSLVSDDGEYDESDDGSSVSGQSESFEAESLSDIAEIGIDDENEARELRRGPTAESSAVRLRKGNTKENVSLVSPVHNRDSRRQHHEIPRPCSGGS